MENMENKNVKEFEAILEDVRNILYANVSAQGMNIHISLDIGSVSRITYEIRERMVKC